MSDRVLFKKIFIYLFIYDCTGLSLLCVLSPVAEIGGYALGVVPGLIAVGFSCCRTQALGTWASAAAAWGLSNSGSQALEHWLSACGAQGLLAVRHVGSFLTWD